MAVLNSNFKRLVLLTSLILSACSNFELPSIVPVEESPQLAETSTVEAPNPAVEEPQPVEEAVVDTPPAVEEEPSPTAEAIEEPSPTPEPTITPTPESVPTATSPPEPTPLPVSIRNGTAEMVLVSESEFEMGALSSILLEECTAFREECDENWFTSSEPIHLVQVDPFYIDAFEITNEAYLIFLNELGEIDAACDGQLCFNVGDSEIESDSEGQFSVDEVFLDHPVTGSTWYGAVTFCESRGARLPSEAEWELAASWDNETSTKYLYPWGDEFDGTAVNSCDVNCAESQAQGEYDDGFAIKAPVGSYENGRSPSGAYDMAGNVWEWTNDWYDIDYYSASPDSNPTGSEDGDDKVVRGGSWFDTGNFTSSAIRFPAPPGESGDSIGFRCVLDALPEEEVLAQVPEATAEPEVETTVEPTIEPTVEPTIEPTIEPTVEPTIEPTMEPTVEPTIEPTMEPTVEPTATPEPTAEATAVAEDSETTATVDVNCELYPGIDNGSTYIVGACDWLAKIASRLGVNYAALLAANPQIDDPNIIHRGQVLNVPPRPGVPGHPSPPIRPPVPPSTFPPGGGNLGP